MTLRSEIQVPDDQTKSTFTTWAQEFTFQVIMVDPCKTSTLNDFTLLDMSRSVKQMPASQVLEKPQDQVSLAYGNLDGFAYCGDRLFEITTQPVTTYSNFLGFEQLTSTFTYGTNQQADVGIYDLEMRVYLVSYPNVEVRKPFKVEIIWCQVTDLELTPLPVQDYEIFTPAIQFSTVDFKQTPDCGYDLEYAIQVKDVDAGTYTPLPLFV